MTAPPKGYLRHDQGQVILYIKKVQEEGCKKSEDILVKEFIFLVKILATKFSSSREPYEDLVQVGMIGLLSSIRRFDLSFNNNFQNYAAPTIVGEIKRHLRDKTWSVYVPRRIRELGPRIKRAVDTLNHDHGKIPKIKELASLLNVTPEEVSETIELGKNYNALSVDSPLVLDSEGNSATLLDMLGIKDKGFEKINEKLLLFKLFDVLDSKEREILIMLYIDCISQKKVGQILGISQMQVSRLQRKAISKLREEVEVNNIN